MTMTERRRAPRIRLDGRLEGQATVLAGFRVHSLSETGATLLMDIPMSVGASCDLSLNLSHVSVDIKGRVVRLESHEGAGAGYRIVVEFDRLHSLDRALLASFLERERRRSS